MNEPEQIGAILDRVLCDIQTRMYHYRQPCDSLGVSTMKPTGLPLFDYPYAMQPKLARRGDPDTSQIGALETRVSGQMAKQAQEVLRAIRHWPGSTSAELAHRMKADRYVPSRRCPSLCQEGLVRRGEHKRKCRITGRECYVWFPVHAGQGEIGDDGEPISDMVSRSRGAGGVK